MSYDFKKTGRSSLALIRIKCLWILQYFFFCVVLGNSKVLTQVLSCFRGCLFGKGPDNKRDGTIYGMVNTQLFPSLCLDKAATFFIKSRQGGIPLETNEISRNTTQKYPYKCFVPE